MTQAEKQSVIDFSEQAYLNYSMYVILDRALPFIGDGLKPVQRRIVYAMSELGLKSTAKYKKSARTVGDVLGKFHPHGDSACYEAMVLMAQPFCYRYPLVDGQGNWGAMDDPKSFAAMRYTESKLSAYADLLLSEVNLGTVNWQDNFDGSLQEPESLPAQVPNLLLNGASGIAVGMATDVPPHNITEVLKACILLLEKPSATIVDVMAVIPAPDYPTKAHIVSSHSELAQIYETGMGSIKMRATYQIEKDCIVIDSLPYQTSGAKVIVQIAQQMRAKKLPLIEDIRDESDHKNPIRLVIVPRSKRVDGDELMLHLFASTDLEKSYRVNLNVIGLDGRPQVKSLLDLLKEWLVYRQQIVERRLKHRLAKITDRLHILAGLLIAYLNLDAVIDIIRNSDEPKTQLQKRFKLSAEQAEAILELKLRHLAKLEQVRIETEQKKLSQEKTQLETVLSSDRRLKTFIKKELLVLLKQNNDKRRCQIVTEVKQAKVLSKEKIMPSENITVIVSKLGWIRNAKGFDVAVENLNYRAGDSFFMAAQGRSNQPLVLLDSSGRAYALSTHNLPSARSQGEPLTGHLSPPDGAEFAAMVMGDASKKIVLSNSDGYGFITTIANLLSKKKAGRHVMSVDSKAKILPIFSFTQVSNSYLAVVSNQGRLLVFELKDLPLLAKGKGSRLLKLKDKTEQVQSVVVLSDTQQLKVISGKRFLTVKFADLVNYIGNRATRGKPLPRGYQKVSRLEVL